MAYSNNITPGKPPLLWQSIKDSFDQINENFTLIGATLTGGEQKNISAATKANPVVVTTTSAHGLTDGQQVTITDIVGMTELNGNTYYANVLTTTTFSLYTDDALTAPVNGTGYGTYVSGGQTQGLLGFSSLDFSNFGSSIVPASTNLHTLGTSSKQWKELHLDEASSTPGYENNGLWIGTAQITGGGGVINLPADSTINGDLIIDPEKRYFRYINLDDGDTVEADHTNDTLSFYGGTGVQLVAGSDADSITFINDGVTQLTGSTGISVSAPTGNITLTNSGVTSVSNSTSLPTEAAGRAAGLGISTSGGTGGISLTNTGVIKVEAGFGITVSADPATGIVNVSNSAPAVPTFQSFVVLGQPTISPDSTSDTLEFITGYGISIVNDAVADTMTISVNQNIDINGSVFADDSTLLVDGVLGRIVADVYADVYGNVTGNVTGDVTGNLTGNSTGYHTGDVTGSVFADNSTLLVDAVTGKFFGDIDSTNINVNVITGTGGADSLNIYADVVGQVSVTDGSKRMFITDTDNDLFEIGSGTPYPSYTPTLKVWGNAQVLGTIIGNTEGYHTGDVTGSVFAQDSTLLVDAADGKIVGPIVSDSIRGNFIGTVFAEDSSVIINDLGEITYTATTPTDWNGTPPTTIGEAIDRIAAKLKLDSGTGA